MEHKVEITKFPKLGTMKLNLSSIEDKAVFFYQLIETGKENKLSDNDAINTAINFITLFGLNK
jgi:hypothetical protein